jgi:hypothetical protein
LRRSKVDLLRRTISVVQQATELEDGSLSWGLPKTTAGRRGVPVPSFVAETLAAHVAAIGANDRDALEGPGPTTVRQPTKRQGANARCDDETTVRNDPKQLLCYSYHLGHEPHPIQALHSGHDSEIPPVAGRLVEVHDDGTLIVDIDGSSRRLWNHDSARLAALVERNRGQVTFQSRWGLLRTPSWNGSFVFSVCDADAPRRDCLSHEPTGTIIDIVDEAGGFTMSSAALQQALDADEGLA